MGAVTSVANIATSAWYDYSELRNAQKYANDIANGWQGLSAYKTGVQWSISNPLNESIIIGSSPDGLSHIADARGCSDAKITELDTMIIKWENVSTAIGDFVDYLVETEESVVETFELMMAEHVDYSGFFGFVDRIADGLYNIIGVDFANSNIITRTIFDFGKDIVYEVENYTRDIAEWFQYGNGKYILNIGKAVIGVGLALVSTIGAIAAIPFTGGTSTAIAIASISALASTTTLVITMFDATYTLDENVNALSYSDSIFDFSAENPAEARLHGNVSGFSDYVEITDFGSKEANDAMETWGKVVDTTAVAAETIGFVAGGITDFGTKTTTLASGDTITSIDLSPSNIKNNVKNMFGLGLKNKTEVDVVTVTENHTLMVDTSADLITDMGVVGEIHAGQITVVPDNVMVRDLTDHTFTINKMTAQSDYISMTTTNGVVTETYSKYIDTVNASSKTFDISGFAKTEDLEKLKEVSDFKQNLKDTKELLQKADHVADFLSGDVEGADDWINKMVTDRKAGAALEKYVISYKGDGEFQIGGKQAEKVIKIYENFTDIYSEGGKKGA